MRFFDLLFAMLALTILSPILLVVSLVLRFTGENEIFYKQKRIGQNGKQFEIIKFATMLKNSPSMGSGTITSKNDSRILPVGRFLRKSKINELPQLFNIIHGNMSLIGPRPHAGRDLDGVDKGILEKILTLKPGLSGVGSIVFRNEEKILHNFENPRKFYDTEIAPYKASLELWYLQHKSKQMYFKLILATLFSLFVDQKKVINIFLKDIPPPSKNLELMMETETTITNWSNK
ncbi:sugar transferase [Amylibacter sp.]|nr:sugar transferase [Amylibacter sp.]